MNIRLCICYKFSTNNVPKCKFGHIQKSDKHWCNSVCRFFCGTLFIQCFIQFRKKPVIATICGILSNAALSALMNKIMHKTSKKVKANGINTAPFAFFYGETYANKSDKGLRLFPEFVCFILSPKSNSEGGIVWFICVLLLCWFGFVLLSLTYLSNKKNDT